MKVTKAIYRDGAGYTLAGRTVEELKEWYLEQMPRYGWQQGKPLKPSNGEEQVLRFAISGWQYAEVAIRPDPNGVQFSLTWGMTRLGNQEQAVAAVFRDLGDDPAFRQFPRTPGTAGGEINIGGPVPGVTIPAAFETRVRSVSDGSWEVELIRSWGDGPHTIWSFQVEPDGVVNRLGQSGDLPPAIR